MSGRRRVIQGSSWRKTAEEEASQEPQAEDPTYYVIAGGKEGAEWRGLFRREGMRWSGMRKVWFKEGLTLETAEWLKKLMEEIVQGARIEITIHEGLFVEPNPDKPTGEQRPGPGRGRSSNYAL